MSIDRFDCGAIMTAMREWTGQNTQQFSVMSRQAARAFDAHAIEAFGIPGVVLMENAGRGFVEILWELPDLKPLRRAVIFCGCGNNGGDGFVIARHLVNRGCAVQTVLCGDPTRLQGDALIHYHICCRMQIPIKHLDTRKPGMMESLKALCTSNDLIVDALFGTGLKGELAEPFITLIRCLNAQHIPIAAVDIPSGLDCDTGLPLPVSIEAAITVTFGGLKQGFVCTPDSRRATGRVFVASIGVEPEIQP